MISSRKQLPVAAFEALDWGKASYREFYETPVIDPIDLLIPGSRSMALIVAELTGNFFTRNIGGGKSGIYQRRHLSPRP